MINFRFHLVSLVAVFLALAIGVIMGTAVIDNAVVDRLQAQQHTLDGKVAAVSRENTKLRGNLGELQQVADRLSQEGVPRLREVPVVVLGVRGADTTGLDRLRQRVGDAGARLLGTLWLTDRWTVDSGTESEDLRTAIGSQETSPAQVRTEALQALASVLRTPAVAGAPEPRILLGALQKAGFLEVEAPQGQPNTLPTLEPGTRFVLLGGANADVADRQLAQPLARALVSPRADRVGASLVVVEATPAKGFADDQLTVPLRKDDGVSRQLSTVDDLDADAGQVSTILALADLGQGRFGHYGHGPAARDLLPAPAPRP